MTVAGILLAAGESSRMGQLKALLPWRGRTLFECQLAAMREASLTPIIVVLGHRAAELSPLIDLPGTQAVLNERYREGKSTSIVAGAAALPDSADAAIVIAVDQPTEPSVLAALAAAQAESGDPIAIPSIDRRRGHPTLFAAALFPELQAITEGREGLREVMIRHEASIHYVDVDNPIIRANLNTPEDYQAAYSRWGSPGYERLTES